MLHGHGNDAYRYGTPVRADFSSNVRRDPQMSAGLQAYLSARFDRIAVYPEVCAESLAARIAEAEQVAPENVLVTSGATAGIHLLAQLHRRASSLVVTPTFSEYEDAGRIHEHRIAFASLEQFLGETLPVSDVVWLCNPNNPTGEVVPRWELLGHVDGAPERMHLVDVAYEAFCDAERIRANDVLERDNLVLVKSMTKVFAVPGLRLGYIIAPRAIVAALERHSMPWSVNALAVEAGKYLLAENDPGVRTALRALLAEARFLGESLARLPGCRVHPSTTHYFLLQLPGESSEALKTWLLREHGLLVRDAANFRGLDGRHVRIAAQSRSENLELISAVGQWLAGGEGSAR